MQHSAFEIFRCSLMLTNSCFKLRAKTNAKDWKERRRREKQTSKTHWQKVRKRSVVKGKWDLGQMRFSHCVAGAVLTWHTPSDHRTLSFSFAFSLRSPFEPNRTESLIYRCGCRWFWMTVVIRNRAHANTIIVNFPNAFIFIPFIPCYHLLVVAFAFFSAFLVFGFSFVSLLTCCKLIVTLVCFNALAVRSPPIEMKENLWRWKKNAYTNRRSKFFPVSWEKSSTFCSHFLWIIIFVPNDRKMVIKTSSWHQVQFAKHHHPFGLQFEGWNVKCLRSHQVSSKKMNRR